MEIKEKTVYFFKGAHCPICEQVLKIFNSEKKDEIIEVLSSEEHLFDIKQITSSANLPIIAWKKNGETFISSGLIDKKFVKKILHDVK
jgi:hypothetical protein